MGACFSKEEAAPTEKKKVPKGFTRLNMEQGAGSEGAEGGTDAAPAPSSGQN